MLSIGHIHRIMNVNAMQTIYYVGTICAVGAIHGIVDLTTAASRTVTAVCAGRVGGILGVGSLRKKS